MKVRSEREDTLLAPPGIEHVQESVGPWRPCEADSAIQRGNQAPASRVIGVLAENLYPARDIELAAGCDPNAARRQGLLDPLEHPGEGAGSFRPQAARFQAGQSPASAQSLTSTPERCSATAAMSERLERSRTGSSNLTTS